MNKEYIVEVELTDEDMDILEELSEELGMTKEEIIKESLKIYRQKLEEGDI